MKELKNPELGTFARIFCLIVLLMSVIGCKELTNDSTRQPLPSAFHHSEYQPLQSQPKKIVTARQIIITDAFVVNTNYARSTPPHSNPGIHQIPGSTYSYIGLTYYMPTNLAFQVAGTDHIVARNFSLDGSQPDVTLILYGDAAKQVVQAISSSWGCHPETIPGWWFPNCNLQFFRGGEHLASLGIFGSGFTDSPQRNVVYSDYSGVLGTLEDIVHKAAEQ